MEDILNVLTEPIFIIDRQHRCIFINDACCVFLGYSREELLNKTAYEFFPKNEADIFHQKDELVFTTGRENVNEEEVTDSKGVVHTIVTTKTLCRRDGKECIVGVIRDVTEQKKTERLLKKVDAELDSIIENIPLMIFVKEAQDLRFVRFNKAGEELLGYSRAELVGKNDHDFFPKEEADFFTAKDREVLEGRKPVDIPEETIQTRHKGRRILHTRKVPILDAAGHPKYLLGISEDITERKRAEDALRQKEAIDSRAQFLSMVSHELRTPLQSMQEGIAVVLEGLLGGINEGQRESLSIAQRNVERLTRLINDVLDVQRLDVHSLAYEADAYDLNEVVTDVVRTMQGVARRKGIDLKLELTPGLPVVRYDRDRMTQVLLNLLNNAVKFTEKGTVTARTARRDGELVISVEDTGVGIRPEDLSKIFKAFGQLRSRADGSRGGGLGLVISKKIIEQYGGSMRVDSEFGRGSLFSFSLPARRDPS
ncbi:MAG TPA: PAS domain S-box protein [Candidatus Eisenbacteria bacterium]|nr:PAS domain S-box protein [Candidatus Eisenbacteria bacterium]